MDTVHPNTIERFELLEQHSAIGWDFDNTLIENRHARDFQNFILANPQIRHVIVTFRTHGMQDQIQNQIPRKLFTAFDRVINISDEAWEQWNSSQVSRRSGLILPGSPAEMFYRTWKGKTCSENGLTAMVDDDFVNTVPGCAEYGVSLFNALARWI